MFAYIYKKLSSLFLKKYSLQNLKRNEIQIRRQVNRSLCLYNGHKCYLNLWFTN